MRIRREIPFTLLLAWLMLLAWPVQALQVSGLYSHRVAVNNGSDTERNRAVAEAMSAVILKVSGERRWLEDGSVQRALRNAQSFVEAISYSSEELLLPVADNAVPATTVQRYIDVDFAPALIDNLLSDAGIPIWDSNRPSVLVWMVLQDAAGERSMLTPDVNTQIITYMQQFADERGLPIIFPVLDFEDRRNLSADQVWALDDRAINAASARYGADSVLSGRLHLTAGGELVGLWQFLFQDQAEVFDGFDNALEPYLFAPLDRITNQLASYFAIIPEAAESNVVHLRVEGVKDLGAYSALLSYVSGLGLVESVSTTALDGERIDLQLGLLGQADQLNEMIALDRDLLPIQSTALDTPSFPNTLNSPDTLNSPNSPNSPSTPTMLHYRWTR